MKYSKQIIFYCIMSMLLSCGNRAMQGTASGSRNTTDTAFNLRVMSYNIHHANPPSRPGVIDMEAVAKVIRQEQPHVLALQEIDVFTNRSGKSLHQAEELGRMTGMKVYFAKAIDHDGGEYGIAILSKFPMEKISNNPLPTADGTDGEHRTLATAVINLPGNKKIVFACTHLDAQRGDTNRLLQMQKITEILKKEKLPVIIAGDFNASPSGKIINSLDKILTRTCVNNCGFTVPQKNPFRTIDFIAFTPGAFNVIEHRVIAEEYASDHLPVMAIMQLRK